MVAVLLVMVLLLAGCGLGFDRTSTTRGGFHTPATPAQTAPGGPSGLPGVKIVTILQNGVTCTLVFWDGLYVGGTC